jgi:hypothetical protein
MATNTKIAPAPDSSRNGIWKDYLQVWTVVTQDEMKFRNTKQGTASGSKTAQLDQQRQWCPYQTASMPTTTVG